MALTAEQFLAELESGPYAWPGGYPRFFIMADGEALSFKAAEENKELILGECSNIVPVASDWKVLACEVNWEDPDLYCAHSGERSESAYAEV